MLKGSVREIKIGGKVRGFKFGTYALGIACREEDVDIIELGRRLNDASKHLLSIVNFLYAAAKSYCIANKLEVDFSPTDVGDWLDELGLDKSLEIIRAGLEVPNKEAPETPGQ
jgi:hypothetical protein